MEREVICVDNKYYILATSARIGQGSRTLKHEESFAIFNAYGDIEPVGLGEQGLYYRGTRYLSRYEMHICDTRPLLLSSSIKEDNSLFTVDLTNADVVSNGFLTLAKGSVHILRSKFLFKNCYYERIQLENFFPLTSEVKISFLFESDFADIFEVRGAKRKKRGQQMPPLVEKDRVVLSYEGLDRVVRQTVIRFSCPPEEISSHQAILKFKLKPKERRAFYIVISCNSNCNSNLNPPQAFIPYKKAFFEIRSKLRRWQESSCLIYTSNEQFNQWLHRSLADIVMLITETPYGQSEAERIYPYAGIPWFNTPFGRDGLITAYECLWINPDIAKGTLAYLAATQAKNFDEEQDAQPGKIIHELREGEMAATGEIPFARYYGSVDATPLFVILAGKYYDRTGDIEFIKKIWPNLLLALKWIESYGDIDRDGFVEYVASERGLINKGWRDSHDSVFHADGTLAEGPIALVEVQGYVYQAKREAAKLAKVLGKEDLTIKWLQEAKELKEKIEKWFWSEEISCYGMALDGQKKLCQVRSSCAGHLLFSGVASAERAQKLAKLFFEKHFFSGWGIRTVSSLEALYNPLSYHNGSVWPHDNALIALGLCRYGFKEQALKILRGLFEASTFFELHRLPELFCGFPKRPSEGPTHYPVACHPQAWAAGAVFLLLQACLGLSFKENEIRFYHPVLPDFLDAVWIKNLKLGQARVNFYVKRYERDVVINVTRKEGKVKIIVEK